jgi:hypothetical protein
MKKQINHINDFFAKISYFKTANTFSILFTFIKNTKC